MEANIYGIYNKLIMLSEVFYMAVLSTGSGIALACFGLLYKSKCSDISCCCGLVKIHRAISSELLEDMAANSTVANTHTNDIESNTHRLSNQTVIQPLQIEH
jgi:hypothetical protein